MMHALMIYVSPDLLPSLFYAHIRKSIKVLVGLFITDNIFVCFVQEKESNDASNASFYGLLWENLD